MSGAVLSGRLPRRNRTRRGITLIEMLVVVIIIALMVSISTPSITAGIDSIRLATATSSVAAFLNSAATRAERRQRPVELFISSGDNSLKFISTDAGSERTLVMPAGISIHQLSSQPLDDLQPVARALFMPGGAVPAIAISLTNQHGGRRVVRLDPMTGFPRVETGEANDPAKQDQ